MTYVSVLIGVVIVAWFVVGLVKAVRGALVAQRGALVQILTRWTSRARISQVLASTSLAPSVKDAIEKQLSAAGVTDGTEATTTQTAPERIEALEALHAEGRITAEKLAQLKATIASEG